jgi:hypothetical protein
VVFLITVGHCGACAFSEFGESQPHRRHFGEDRFVLRRVGQLSQPQAVSSALPVLRTRGHLDPSLRSLNARTGIVFPNDRAPALREAPKPKLRSSVPTQGRLVQSTVWFNPRRKGPTMRHDPEAYRRYAEECQLLAKTMPDEHRRTLLAMAESWMKLAQEAENPKLRSE